MKKALVFLLLSLAACGQPGSIKEEKYHTLDSLIVKSNQVLDSSEKVQKLSDSVSEEKIQKVVFRIKYLNNEIEKYRLERIMLTNALKISTEKVRIDTVYIERKKNFWGKEKTTISVKSDSLQSNVIDSLKTEENLVDTTSQDQ